MRPRSDADATKRHLPVAGDVVAGKYAIVKVLGEGGMGVVYEAMHQKLRQRVAIKMLLPALIDEVIVERFEREARAAAKLASRHVARVIDVDVTADGVPYMVMELLQGHDLQAELETRTRLEAGEAVDYVLQTCAAMMEAHLYGIVHRDLKPSNLFLAWDGETRIVKVLDFGISKVQGEGDARLTGAETVMGTAMYMSPEQVKASGSVDARADIWAIGVILYELLAGRAPFEGTPTQVAAQIVTERAPDLGDFCSAPPELAAIVRRALEMRPEDRFPNVRELVIALAPHAPGSSTGRMFADAVAMGSSGSYPRVSSPVSPAAPEKAPTTIQASAVSQPARRDGGTAPGWSKHRVGASRSSGMLVAMIVAFVGGTIVLGGGAYLFLRPRGAPPIASATATTVMPTEAPTPAVVDPPTPAPTASAAPDAPPKPSASASQAQRLRPPRPGTATAPPIVLPPATPPAKPKPATPAPAASNPLLL